MKHVVSLRKVGKFYQCYEDDAYVIHALMNYNICNGKVGFPITSLGKVQNKLDEFKINYQILEKDSIMDSKDFKNSNKYDKYLNEGIKSFDKIKSDEELLEKIKNLSDDKVDKIKKFILEVINEE